MGRPPKQEKGARTEAVGMVSQQPLNPLPAVSMVTNLVRVAIYQAAWHRLTVSQYRGKRGATVIRATLRVPPSMPVC
jgi:hypothetical protein